MPFFLGGGGGWNANFVYIKYLVFLSPISGFNCKFWQFKHHFLAFLLRMDLQINGQFLHEHKDLLNVFTKRDNMQVVDYQDYLNEENNRLIHRVD